MRTAGLPDRSVLAAHCGVSAMVTTRSWAATSSPTATWIPWTTPATGADTTVSIFIAESTRSGSPASHSWPDLAWMRMTDPGIGAPTEPGTWESALGRRTCLSARCVSATLTERGKPLTSKKTSREPVLGSSEPTPRSLMSRCLPRSMTMSTSSPCSSGSMKVRVGRIDTSPYALTWAWNSSKTLGYMTADMRSVSLTGWRCGCFEASAARVCSRSIDGSSAPGRPSNVRGCPAALRTSARSGSGKPPGGMPSAPWKNSTTDCGKERCAAFALTSAAERPLVTMNCARSPHVLEDGVTLTMSPSSWFASA
mmetsp:Transcript_4665/g.18992  ORF Transcript_4665/g.18992 Transcript_4665/m.18992 type:complete len:310 (-) Transcript_4665:405-1334(-)